LTVPQNDGNLNLVSFPQIAAGAVRTVERVPLSLWAAWILGVVVATGLLAMNTPNLG